MSSMFSILAAIAEIPNQCCRYQVAEAYSTPAENSSKAASALAEYISDGPPPM